MATDIKKIVDGLKTSVDNYANIELHSDITKVEALSIIVKEFGIINAIEKREFEEKLQKDEYELRKDHTYALDNLDKQKFEFEKKKHDDSINLDKSKLDLEKDKLDLEKDKLNQSINLDQQKIDLEKEKSNKDNELDKEKLNLEKDKLKEEKIQNEIRKNIADHDFEIEKLKLEYEKSRLDLEKDNVKIQNEIRADNKKFQIISLGITAGTALLAFIGKMVSLCVSKKLAYDNLKLIYIDEGRPTTEWKDSVKRIESITKQ